jgi:CMP-N-acetylneuraminic acid synthetase
MIDGRRVLSVTPARGGSKGLPMKNIRPVKGVPLVAMVGPVVDAVPYIDRKIVSTDHPEIARVAEAAGLDAPYVQPPEVSGDRNGDVDVLTYALTRMEEIDACRYDIVVMLQPTSPLRTAADITATIEKLVAERRDAVWTVTPSDSKHHPLKQLVVSQDGHMDYYDRRGADIQQRQQLSPLWYRNGAAYAITRDLLLEKQAIMGPNSAAVVLDRPMVSIDTEWDVKLVEFILDQQCRDRP